MVCGVFHDPRTLAHRHPHRAAHPERPERITAVLSALLRSLQLPGEASEAEMQGTGAAAAVGTAVAAEDGQSCISGATGHTTRESGGSGGSSHDGSGSSSHGASVVVRESGAMLELRAAQNVHSERYLQKLELLLEPHPKRRLRSNSNLMEEAEQFDSVYMNQHSLVSARVAAGTLIKLVRAVVLCRAKRLGHTIKGFDENHGLIVDDGKEELQNEEENEDEEEEQEEEEDQEQEDIRTSRDREEQEVEDCSGGGDEVIGKEAEDVSVLNGFALIRPPGHHAEPHTAMGFSILNNVAIAARYAVDKLGLERVLIVDWDIHHGNGTQKAFAHDRSVLYFSVHRHDRGAFFPQGKEGSAASVGTGEGEGFTVNVALDGAGHGDASYVEVFRTVLMPIARQFNPQLVLVSAGFDAAQGDTLGGFHLTPTAFAWMTHTLCSDLADGHIILALEGGYKHSVLGECVSACVHVLQKHAAACESHTVSARNRAESSSDRGGKLLPDLACCDGDEASAVTASAASSRAKNRQRASIPTCAETSARMDAFAARTLEHGEENLRATIVTHAASALLDARRAIRETWNHQQRFWGPQSQREATADVVAATTAAAAAAAAAATATSTAAAAAATGAAKTWEIGTSSALHV